MSYAKLFEKAFAKGFTMIELIIVIAIMGILTSLAVPAFQNLSQNARVAATRGSLGAIRSALAIRYAQSATGGSGAAYPGSLTTADFADGKNPKNSLTGGGTGGIVTTSATVNTTVTSTNAFWYISSGASGGQAGAYTGTATDLIDVSTF